MNKKTERGLVIGLAVGAAGLLALSSKKVRSKISGVTKSKEKSKLDAIKNILEDKTNQGIEKTETLKDRLAEKKNNNK